MPHGSYNGKEWGVQPKLRGKGDEAEEHRKIACGCLSARTWASTGRQNRSRAVDREIKLLTCGCSQGLSAKNSYKGCTCRGRKCSLACGCTGRCHVEGSSAPSTPVPGPGPSVPKAPPGPACCWAVASAIPLFLTSIPNGGAPTADGAAGAGGISSSEANQDWTTPSLRRTSTRARASTAVFQLGNRKNPMRAKGNRTVIV